MTISDAVRPGLAKVRALSLDVDGVLTDGGFWWGPAGEEWKRFCFADVMGLSLARRAGIVLALISGEDSPLVHRYAEKMLIRHVITGCREKATALRNFADEAGIPLPEICFMGDDVNDLAALALAGFSAAPASASRLVLERVSFVTQAPGGNGAVRELVEALLAARGLAVHEVFSRP
jgi:3-deoxy-D-manno-octulosonate 8-phosphate phosphatase (KDO 8-P phosphatase)